MDGHNKGDVVGVRRLADGPDGTVFTPEDYEKLPNYLAGDCDPYINTAPELVTME